MPRGKRHTHWFTDQARAAAFRWLLVLLVLGSAAWVWWRSRQGLPGPPPAAPVAVTNHPAPLPPPLALPPASNSPGMLVRTATPPVVVITNPPPVRPATSAPPLVAFTNPPPVPPVPPVIAVAGYPRSATNVLEAQIALARLRISPGCIDGAMGFQTREALQVFQRLNRLPVTGELDAATHVLLRLESPPLAHYVITTNDAARLQPLGTTWLAKSEQSAMDYETLLELVAEKSLTSQKGIQRLNPEIEWTRVRIGQTVAVPDADPPVPKQKAALIRISLGHKTLQVFDAQANVLAHFPCSIAQRVEKRPVGELHVTAVAPNPNYTFNPASFPESEEARAMDRDRRLVLPPGPNNPVGLAWIGLSKPGYGIHGTPVPEQVGRTESHGCFRLANWNATLLSRLVTAGTPVIVEP